MQTVQLQCGSCSNVMAISVEHLGQQVQCPHCSAVVQTPPASALVPQPGPDPAGAAVTPPPPQYPSRPPQYQPAPSIQVPERESIFSEPEPSDDIFGGDTSPKVQMPEPAHASASDNGHAAAEEHEEEHVDMTAARQRLAHERKSSSLAPTLLVFLIPYSIFTTAFLAYLLMTWPKLEAFEWLPDPKARNAGRALVLPRHDLPMPAKLKVPLGGKIVVGQMEYQPLKVVRNGDVLTLRFKAKNLSTNQAIMPVEPEFFVEPKVKAENSRTFTFLESPPNSKDSLRFYGGDVDFVPGNGDLQPGQECTVELSTGIGERAKDRVRSLLAKEGKYQWRVQVRRGTHFVHKVETPLTAVIGIEFAKNDIDG